MDLILLAIGFLVGVAVEAVTGVGKSLYAKVTQKEGREKPMGGGGPGPDDGP